MNFLKAKNTYIKNAFIQKQMAKNLTNMLLKNNLTSFDKVFEFGCGLGIFSEILQEKINFKKYFLNDFYKFDVVCKYNEFEIFDMNELKNHHFYDKKFDLIASNACVQWLDFDLLIENIFFILEKNGYFLFSTFGEKNFIQIKQSANLSLNYLNLEQIKEKLSKKFKILQIKEEILNIKFESSLDVFRHLKFSGVNSLNNKFFISKEFLKKYEKDFENTLTYNPIFILCKK